jgi:hypothetical protein
MAVTIVTPVLRRSPGSPSDAGGGFAGVPVTGVLMSRVYGRAVAASHGKSIACLRRAAEHCSLGSAV